MACASRQPTKHRQQQQQQQRQQEEQQQQRLSRGHPAVCRVAAHLLRAAALGAVCGGERHNNVHPE